MYKQWSAKHAWLCVILDPRLQEIGKLPQLDTAHIASKEALTEVPGPEFAATKSTVRSCVFAYAHATPRGHL